MRVQIIVDSTSDLLPETRAQVDAVVPLSVIFGEETFLDGVTIDKNTFYEKLIETDVLPKTSQPTPDAFARVFAEVQQAGDEAVVITLSGKLSGTFQSANIAAVDFPGIIHLVDSNTVAIGGGILVELALRLRDQGLSAAEIVRKLEEEKEHIRLVALLDTLEYLKLGGRISRTVAFAGGLLNMKPVVAVEDGEVVSLGNARGSKRGNNMLVQEINKAGGVDFSKPVLLGYTGLSDDLLQKYIKDSIPLYEGQLPEPRCTQIGSVIGTHAGPGAVAVAFFAQP